MRVAAYRVAPAFQANEVPCWASSCVGSSNKGSGRNAEGFHPAIELVPGNKNFPPQAASA